jgi:rhodanese-related sulfurtransferase
LCFVRLNKNQSVSIFCKTVEPIIMKKYLILIVLAVSVSVAFSCNSSITQAQAESSELQEAIVTRNVSAKDFQQLINDKTNATLLDVRTPNEISQGIIKNAEKIDFYDPEFKAKLDKLDKNEPVLIYCRSGRRSGIAMSTLRELGFSEIYNLQGGILEWSEAGFKIEK